MDSVSGALDQAARNMQQAANGTSQEQEQASQRAMEQLERAQRLLADAQGGSLDERLANLQGQARQLAQKQGRIAEETERGWQGFVTDEGGLRFERVVRGVKEVASVDVALIGSADARHMDQMSARLREIYSEPPVLTRKDGRSEMSGPRALLDSIFATGRKGLSMQRYKGLGEMNAEQLWETTLDPNVRSLLQVKVNDATDADGLFSRLMGDEVEPRRDFIQENALSVANLDI